jgi:sialate O-acetylesterase
MRRCAFTVLLFLVVTAPVQAELKMSPVFGDHMVLQRNRPVHVWGWTTPGQKVQAAINGQSVSGTAGSDGRFDLNLPEMKAGGPHELTITADESRTFKDVLIGEVWVCSGQSNMAWNVSSANDADLESLSANYPEIRLISVPQVASQEPLHDFKGAWEACTPESARSFSAVGYFFGRQLHQTLDVPIGLIDNAWGGSACEAWIRRDILESDDRFSALMDRWQQTESSYDAEAAQQKYQAALKKWQETRRGNRPRAPRNPLTGNQRPANLYCGVLSPVMGYTIQGVIWYQGESNAGRAYQYRDLFPLMIQNWRDDWGQGDFPFYWVQLADFMAEKDAPSGSAWAELREAQTMTMSKLPNTGEAVIIDLGEANDIHPTNKQDVAKRLARWALANQYGVDVPFRSPQYQSHEVVDGKIRVKFDHVAGGLDTFDVSQVIGFQIAGADQKFVLADARIIDGDGRTTVEVWSDAVSEPVAVRYAWADNPVCNLRSKAGLPVTPFRTDDWPGVTADAR